MTRHGVSSACEGFGQGAWLSTKRPAGKKREKPFDEIAQFSVIAVAACENNYWIHDLILRLAAVRGKIELWR